MSGSLTPPSPETARLAEQPIALSFFLSPSAAALERMTDAVADRALDAYAADEHGRSLDWHAGWVVVDMLGEGSSETAHMLSVAVAERAHECASAGRRPLL